jgi:hypothetical protein
VATAVEARNFLRLGPEAAFGVIASTLHGAPGHPAVLPSAAVSSVELAELKRSSEEYAVPDAPPARAWFTVSVVEALRCCCEVK